MANDRKTSQPFLQLFRRKIAEASLAFMERWDEVTCEDWKRFWRLKLKEDVATVDRDSVRNQVRSIDSMRECFTPDYFDRRAVNRRLKQSV